MDVCDIGLYRPIAPGKMLLPEHKNTDMFKAKRLWSKSGYQLPQPGTLITCRQLLITASTFTCTSKIPQPDIFTLYQHSSPSQTHSFIQTHTHTHTLSLSLARSLTHSLTNTHSRTQGHAQKSVNIFDWGIFRAACKNRGAAQELSAKVIRAVDWRVW